MKMNKKLLRGLFTLLLCLCTTFSLYSQSNNTVDISDEVYSFLNAAELQGLCGPLATIRPYTEKYICEQIDLILDNLDSSQYKNKDKLSNIAAEYKSKYERDDGLQIKYMAYKISDEKNNVPVSLTVDLYSDTFFTGGVYSDSSLNTFSYDLFGYCNFSGDIGSKVSYRSLAYLGFTKMNLKELGEYNIGWWWYDDYGLKKDFVREDHFSDRTIKTYRNYAVLPYSYKKPWDGSVYPLTQFNSSGLTGWPFGTSGAFGMQGEIHATLFDGLLDLGIGRYSREWGAMDKGSSLVLNESAHPFFGIDTSLNLFDWLSFSVLTGFLEFPNQNYINQGAWYRTDEHGNEVLKSAYEDENKNHLDIKDSFFFHNLFSMVELDIDYKNIHFDFGSTVVYPNRFELGYSFPLTDRLVYQNNVGDYDNLALYANLKYMYPGIASVWGSVYIDEINAFGTDIFHNTRCMFAYQGGTKVNIPFLPFGNLSVRYTKVEPYCYTHEALNPGANQPYYPNYICENYTNNGDSLGYYLQPNSDELFVKIETRPFTASSFNFHYQLIRHGVDWGSGSYIYSGSNIYSELPAGSYGPGRNNLHKYFLKDGVYEWMNVFAIEAAYNFNYIGIPVQLYSTVGYVNNWFTTIGGATPSKDAKYYTFSNEEYKANKGVVISVGIKAFSF